MERGKNRSIAFGLLFFVSTSVLSAPKVDEMYIYGRLSCQDFMTDRSLGTWREVANNSWFFGYIEGYAQALGVSNDIAYASASEAEKYMKRYCETYPKATLKEGIAKMVEALVKFNKDWYKP